LFFSVLLFSILYFSCDYHFGQLVHSFRIEIVLTTLKYGVMLMLASMWS
jgi:hypothetical protein